MLSVNAQGMVKTHMLASGLAWSLVLGACLTFGTAAEGLAQGFPTKPVRIVVPLNPGGLPDLVARIIAPGMSQVLAQPVLIDNRPGANQMIAYEHVAKNAAADGYTVILVTISDLALAPVAAEDLRFDPLKDVSLFAAVGGGKYALVSPAAAAWRNFNEMVAAAKANPDKFNYGVVNHFQRFVTPAILDSRGVKMTAIMYTGTAILQALAANEIQLGLVSEGTAASIGPKYRWLAITGQQRSGARPEVPTFAELGYPQVKGTNYALALRAGTPKAVVDTLHAATIHALRLPEVQAQFAKLSMEVFDDNSAEAATNELSQQAKFYAESARQMSSKTK